MAKPEAGVRARKLARWKARKEVKGADKETLPSGTTPLTSSTYLSDSKS